MISVLQVFPSEITENTSNENTEGSYAEEVLPQLYQNTGTKVVDHNNQTTNPQHNGNPQQAQQSSSSWNNPQWIEKLIDLCNKSEKNQEELFQMLSLMSHIPFISSMIKSKGSSFVSQRVMPYFKVIRKNQGEIIYNQDDLGTDGLYILLRGECDYFSKNKWTSEKKHLGVITPGNIIGQLSLGTDRRTFTAVADNHGSQTQEVLLLQLKQHKNLARFIHAQTSYLLSMLNAFPCFQSCTLSSQLQMLPFLQFTTFSRNQTVYSFKQPADRIYFIVSGEFHLHSTLSLTYEQPAGVTGTQFTDTFLFNSDLSHLCRGHVFGEEEIIENKDSREFEVICASSEGALLVLQKDHYLFRFVNDPRFHNIFLTISSQKKKFREQRITQILEFAKNNLKQDDKRKINQQVLQLRPRQELEDKLRYMQSQDRRNKIRISEFEASYENIATPSRILRAITTDARTNYSLSNNIFQKSPQIQQNDKNERSQSPIKLSYRITDSEKSELYSSNILQSRGNSMSQRDSSPISQRSQNQRKRIDVKGLQQRSQCLQDSNIKQNLEGYGKNEDEYGNNEDADQDEIYLKPKIFYDNSVNLSKSNSLVYQGYQGGDSAKKEINNEEFIASPRIKKQKNEESGNSPIVKHENDGINKNNPSSHLSLQELMAQDGLEQLRKNINKRNLRAHLVKKNLLNTSENSHLYNGFIRPTNVFQKDNTAFAFVGNKLGLTFFEKELQYEDMKRQQRSKDIEGTRMNILQQKSQQIVLSPLKTYTSKRQSEHFLAEYVASRKQTGQISQNGNIFGLKGNQKRRQLLIID